MISVSWSVVESTMNRIALLALCLLLIVPANGGTSVAGSEELLHVSAPRFELRDDESVESIKCHVVGGIIVNVSRVLEMWTFKITNGDGGMSDLTADALVGAAEFRDANYFRNFLLIERPNPPGKYDRPFDITMSVVVATNPDGTPKRTLTFTRKELVLSVEASSTTSNPACSAK
jgi:hypothetical protein